MAQVQMKVRKVQVLRKRRPYRVKADIELYFRTEIQITEYKIREGNLEIAGILNDYVQKLTDNRNNGQK